MTTEWRVIETLPSEDFAGIFWLVWARGCGGGSPHPEPLYVGKNKCWCSLYTATHWMPMFDPPISPDGSHRVSWPFYGLRKAK